MKTIVTHKSPDLDAITACWLLKNYLPGWYDAEIRFVPAGLTLENLPPDENPEVLHVDTGLGKFDHHQSNDRTCASKKVFDFLIAENHIRQVLKRPLEKLIEFVIEDDHFQEIYYPEPDADRYEFLLNNLISGLKIKLGEDLRLTEYIFTALDGCLEKLKNKVHAEEELKKGLDFKSYLGKSFAIESSNDEILRHAQKVGYKLVIRKDPKFGNIRIKTPPDPDLDLTPVYNNLLKKDKIGFWYLHPSKHMLLNGSPKRPDQTPSPLKLPEVIEIIKNL